MACHEIAGLRLGLMRLLRLKDEAVRQHELTELGDGAIRPGLIQAMCEANDLKSLCRFYEAALSILEEQVAATSPSDPKLPYLRSLIILTKRIEMDLANQVDALTRLFNDLGPRTDARLRLRIYPVD